MMPNVRGIADKCRSPLDARKVERGVIRLLHDRIPSTEYGEVCTRQDRRERIRFDCYDGQVRPASQGRRRETTAPAARIHQANGIAPEHPVDHRLDQRWRRVEGTGMATPNGGPDSTECFPERIATAQGLIMNLSRRSIGTSIGFQGSLDESRLGLREGATGPLRAKFQSQSNELELRGGVWREGIDAAAWAPGDAGRIS